MSMSDSERALLVTGTLDTSGVGGSPYANLDQVAVAFGAEVFERPSVPQEEVAVAVAVTPEPEQKAAENSPSEPVEETELEVPKAAVRTKRAPAKKAQASAPADE